MLLDEPVTGWSGLSEHWPQTQADLLKVLDELKTSALALPGAALEVVSRAGVSISLRFSLKPAPKANKRPVFHLIDVVAFDDELFLSVCFYADQITDPEELGNLVPLGLFGEDGYCFDLEEPEQSFTAYLKERQAQAHKAASESEA